MNLTEIDLIRGTGGMKETPKEIGSTVVTEVDIVGGRRGKSLYYLIQYFQTDKINRDSEVGKMKVE